ncbi:MAG: excinuclease ABC subunit UvrC [Patescibacteria group bacterium]
MLPAYIRIKNDALPDTPGVYLMKDAHGKILYVGKAVNLKRRVNQHFERPHGPFIQEMTPLVREIDYIEKGTAIEALILEANLIKLHWPKYNVMLKDNKSFMYLVITDEEYPRPILKRATDLAPEEEKHALAVFGPYLSARSLRVALDLVRKVFPWSTCSPDQQRACFDYQIGRCPGVCIRKIDPKMYKQGIRNLIKFFEGKKEEIVKAMTKEMEKLAKEQKFEEAAKIRNQLFSLEHIQDIALLMRDEPDARVIKRSEGEIDVYGRIEGYDISHISGTSQVASMVVFQNGAPAKAQYRKFKIKTVDGSNDVASLKEVLTRRLKHDEWPLPQLLLIDGGKPQVHAVEEVVRELGVQVPVVGMAKGPERKRTDLICSDRSPSLCQLLEPHIDMLTQVRDESHRFAITFHRKVRSDAFVGKKKRVVKTAKRKV